MHRFLPALLFCLIVHTSLLGADPAETAKPVSPAEAAAAQKAAAESLLEIRYQALVAALPPEQQAWEQVLQANLGNGFYLPIHKRERVAGTISAWSYVADVPGLPRVLLIGDSVSRGYTLPVRAALEGKANVHRAPENCGPTANGLKKLDVWLNSAPPAKWDVIHFNFGIHDRTTAPEVYEQRLEEIVTRLEKTGARLIWASTTPIPANEEQHQTPESIVERNAVAAWVMERHHIAIDDLFAFITPHLAEAQNPNDVHFTAQGYEMLGGQVAVAITAALPAK